MSSEDRASTGGLGADRAAARLHELEIVSEPRLAERLRHALDVLGHARANRRVQADGREALVLPVERQYLVGDRRIRLGELLLEDRCDSPLVLRVEVGVQQAHRDCLDTRRLQLANALAHLAVIQLDKRVAVRRRDPLVDGEPMTPFHERMALPRQLAVKREVVGPFVSRDVEDVAHTLGGDQPHRCTGSLEHDVCRNGGAVENRVDAIELEPVGLAQLRDARDGTARRIVRRRRDLVDVDRAGLLVHEDQVGERPSDVDADALHSGLLRSLAFAGAA